MSIRQVQSNLKRIYAPTPTHAAAHTQQSAADCADCKTVNSRVTNHKNALWLQHRKDAAVMGSRAKKPTPTAKPID
jgi:DNA replication protein DnaC